MGLFLGLAGIIGANELDVVSALTTFAEARKGILRPEVRSTEGDDTLVICPTSGNVSVLFPWNFMEWTEASQELSRTLKKCVFSFHIHDGDLWMYDLFRNGTRIDGFNPIPDYWNEDISDEERNSYKGNAEIVSQCVPGLQPATIANYLVNWDLEEETPLKAYPDDEFDLIDRQMVDFMRKLNLVYPIGEASKPLGKTYLLTPRTVQPKLRPRLKS